MAAISNFDREISWSCLRGSPEYARVFQQAAVACRTSDLKVELHSEHLHHGENRTSLPRWFPSHCPAESEAQGLKCTAFGHTSQPRWPMHSSSNQKVHQFQRLSSSCQNIQCEMKTRIPRSSNTELLARARCSPGKLQCQMTWHSPTPAPLSDTLRSKRLACHCRYCPSLWVWGVHPQAQVVTVEKVVPLPDENAEHAAFT